MRLRVTAWSEDGTPVSFDGPGPFPQDLGRLAEMLLYRGERDGLHRYSCRHLTTAHANPRAVVVTGRVPDATMKQIQEMLARRSADDFHRVLLLPADAHLEFVDVVLGDGDEDPADWRSRSTRGMFDRLRGRR